MTARARTSSGLTRVSLNSGRFLSRATSCIAAVTSTVIHSVTCGLVKADWLIADAIILRTPLIGSRVSRAPGAAATAAGAAATGAVRGVLDAAPWTSSRVIDPDGPEPVTVV